MIFAEVVEKTKLRKIILEEPQSSVRHLVHSPFISFHFLISLVMTFSNVTHLKFYERFFSGKEAKIDHLNNFKHLNPSITCVSWETRFQFSSLVSNLMITFTAHVIQVYVINSVLIPAKMYYS